MKDLIGDDHKTLHPRLMEACQKDLDSFEAEQIRKVYPGVVRPKLRLESFKIGQCEVQLGDDDAYNDHMRNLHGVVTTVSDKKHRSGIYPNLNNIPSSNGVEGILNELVPTLKTISAAGGQHVPMNRLKAKPGRKEVEMGIDDLKTVLAADGRVVPGAVTAPLDSYGHITTRMKELVHESDHPVMQRAYAQLAGRRWERGHILKIEHMEKAIREIINKNSAEIAMKRFSDFRFSELRGLSSQIVDMANMVEEFFHEEMQVISYEKDANGVNVPLLINPTYTKQLKDALCIYKIVTKAPEYENAGYKGKIRELLQPAIENISVFDMDHLCKVLKKWEEDWSMFEDKPKPAEKGDKAAANLAKGGRIKKEDSPPVEKKTVEKLKQEVAKISFTTVTFRKHAKNVDDATFGKNSNRLCYWCLGEECLKGRMKQWFKEKPNEPKIKGYAVFRTQVDKLTCNMCPKYPEVNQRKEKGAEIYLATTPDSEAEISILEESMSEEESMSIPEEKNGYYHCYISCANYTNKCRNPEECKQQKKEKKPSSQCPMNKVLKDHYCGEVGEMEERHFNRANRERKPKWVRAGIVGNMVKYKEARDYLQKEEDTIQAHYIEVIEKPSKTEVSNGDLTVDISDDFGG